MVKPEVIYCKNLVKNVVFCKIRFDFRFTIAGRCKKIPKLDLKMTPLLFAKKVRRPNFYCINGVRFSALSKWYGDGRESNAIRPQVTICAPAVRAREKGRKYVRRMFPGEHPGFGRWAPDDLHKVIRDPADAHPRPAAQLSRLILSNTDDAQLHKRGYLRTSGVQCWLAIGCLLSPAKHLSGCENNPKGSKLIQNF